MRVICSTSIGCGFDLDTAMGRAAAAGFDSIDLLVIHDWAFINPLDFEERWDSTVARIDGLLEKHGLTVAALNSSTGVKLDQRGPEYDALRRSEYRGLVRFMNYKRLSTCAIVPPIRYGEPWDRADQDRCMDSLEEILAMGDEAGLRFPLELHFKSPFENDAQIDRLLQRFPDLPLVYDPSHYVMTGRPLRDSERLMKNAAIVHLRDAADGEMQVSLGEGVVDFDWIIDRLQEQGYDGIVAVELLGLEDTSFDVVEQSRALRDRILARLEDSGA